MPRLTRVAVVLAALTVAFAVSVTAVFAQWPTTCVELNDIVERQRGQPENAGIYQRVYGDAAEPHCQADHREDVQRAFWWALSEGPPPPPAAAVPWPTTCADLNDIVEAHLGNDGNVGIYQRAYGDQAEPACQADHYADVRSVFAWALPLAPPPAPAPTEHPDYERVRQVAIARGAASDLAAAIAGDVIGRGAVDAFLHGTDDGALYGRYDCQWQSTACPLAPEQPPPPPGPQIDPALQHVWDRLMASIRDYVIYDLWLVSDQALTVRFGALRPGVNASYGWFRHDIIISDRLRFERTEALVALLAHELWHAVSPIPFPGNLCPVCGE